MHHIRFHALAALLLIAAFAGSCGGGGGTVIGVSGKVAGSVDIEGPFNGAVELNVGLFPSTGGAPVQTAVAGRVTSVATASLSGRTITYEFTDLPLADYVVKVYSTGPGGQTDYYTSGNIELTVLSPNSTGQKGELSFTGAGPFGGLSGIVQLEGDTDFPSNLLIFVGISPASAPQNVLQHMVASDDVDSSQRIFFNLSGMAYGTWLVGFYGYNPVTRAITTFGLLDEPVTINASHELVTGAVFPANFAGDPGDDPALATISGRVTLSAALPASQYIAIAANTVPPQQGAPPATFDVTPARVNSDNTIDFTLPELLDGAYSVSIFSYDFATHQAVYFGEYSTNVTIAGGASVSGINFNADVSIID